MERSYSHIVPLAKKTAFMEKKHAKAGASSLSALWLRVHSEGELEDAHLQVASDNQGRPLI